MNDESGLYVESTFQMCVSSCFTIFLKCVFGSVVPSSLNKCVSVSLCLPCPCFIGDEN